MTEPPAATGEAHETRRPLPDRTLVVRFGRVGDLLVVTPVLRALRVAHPAMRIHVLTTDDGRVVLRNNPHVDELHVLRARRPPRWLNAERVGLERRLAAQAFDAVVLLETAERYRDLAARLGADHVYGYARPGQATGPDEAVRGRKHELQNSFAVLERMGITPAGEHYDFRVAEPARRRAQALLGRHGVAGMTLIGVHPGFHRRRFRRKRHPKAWPHERWAAVIRRLVSSGNRSVVLTGTRRERRDNARILRMAGVGLTVNIAGETDLETLAAVLDRCAVFIAPDTGPAHLAAAVRTPLVALFGPEPPEIMGPRGDEQRIARLYPAPSSAPPRDRGDHHPRMWAITVDDVVHEAERLLARRTAASAGAGTHVGDAAPSPHTPDSRQP